MSIFIDMNIHIVSPLKHMYAGMQTDHFDSMCYAKMAKRERNGHSDEIANVKPGFSGPGSSQRLVSEQISFSAVGR